MNLSPTAMLVISLVTMVVLWFLTIIWVGILKRPKPSELTLKWAVFIISALLAVVFNPVTLPALPVWGGDPATFVNALLIYTTALLAIALTIMKVAQFIFDQIWQKVMAWLDTGVVAKLFKVSDLTAWLGFLRPLSAPKLPPPPPNP